MDNNKSLDQYKLIAALCTDVYTSYGSVINTKSLRLTLNKVKRRLASEGSSFLTKTLPRLGKAFDKALAEETPLVCTPLGFKPYKGTQLPKLFGELFEKVLQPNGAVLQCPCVNSIKHIRQLLYLFYKYELPYSDEQEQQVLGKFERTERDLETISARLRHLGDTVAEYTTTRRRSPYYENRKWVKTTEQVVREARNILSDVFAFFDPKDVIPRHGPGAVATKQQLWTKYLWTNVSAKITRVYPLDAYFYASKGHICDRIDSFARINQEDLPARVILVPKDSRGPRLISCEPVDYQWVQQGLGAALVQLLEHHPLTKWSVFFTDQAPNRWGALLGSSTGKYATLDLNEASDRVSLELVRLLFPPHIYEFLESCRSSSTVMPDGLVLPLWKFAPMGSCLCFPVMALTIFAILAAAAPDTDASHMVHMSGNRRVYHMDKGIHVYGDDVIVPTAYAEDAIELLESFGLKVNRDKSCIKGFFRESCGMDAYKGVPVTPVRLRTLWSSTPSPDSYASWIAYANSFWDKKYYTAYHYVVGLLHSVYGAIPAKDMNLSCPSLAYVPDELRPKRSRVKPEYQKVQWYVRDVKSPRINKEIDGWSMLLRYFTEFASSSHPTSVSRGSAAHDYSYVPDLSVSSYTRRRSSMLVRRWR